MVPEFLIASSNEIVTFGKDIRTTGAWMHKWGAMGKVIIKNNISNNNIYNKYDNDKNN